MILYHRAAYHTNGKERATGKIFATAPGKIVEYHGLRKLPLPRYPLSRYGKKRLMEKELYDPYFRTLPSNVTPERTPFTRSGRNDAGHLFICTTNKWRRWSLLLDKMHRDGIYEEALQYIPRGIFQLWLVEK